LEFGGVLLQQMVKGGMELILGGIRDKAFGPTVLFGLGGIHAEVIKDYSIAVAPVSKAEALRMISSVKMGPLLRGQRGGVRVDLDELAEIISRFSRIQAENPSIEELEINPLIATDQGFSAVDARVILK
jgi:acetyl-CoA synthetase (ADP-forming)